MKRTIKPVMLMLIIFSALSSPGQAKGESEARIEIKCSPSVDPSSDNSPQIHHARIIQDFGTHQLWILNRNLARPEAPGSLVPLAPTCELLNMDRNDANRQVNFHPPRISIIRAGETLILSDHTYVSELHVRAIALTTAAVGEVISVRLTIGGPTLHALVTSLSEATILQGVWTVQP